MEGPKQDLSTLSAAELFLGQLERRAALSRVGRMRRHSGRFVDGEKGAVFVKDRERLTPFSLGSGKGLEMANDLLSRGHRPRLDEHPSAVDPHRPGGDQQAGASPRKLGYTLREQ
jgi:hypothetical protein